MTQQSKKKTVEYHFIDVNDPDRYKKLKVSRACDYCRKRKSKCDIGVPGSGTCSNCIKSKNQCVYSPVSSTRNYTHVSKQKSKSSHSLVKTTPTLTHASPSILNENINKAYHNVNSKPIDLLNTIFSIDSRGISNYEKSNSNECDHMIFVSSMNEIPHYAHQMDQDLFQIYFDMVHPFFPILDRYYISQSIQSLPLSLKWAIMAIALHFTTDDSMDTTTLANTFYKHASIQLDHTPSIHSIQSLFLLYKYQEIISPVGSSLSSNAFNHLNEIQSMLSHLELHGQHPFRDLPSSITWDEFLCRARWILLIIATLNTSRADQSWKAILDRCIIPLRSPSLTETEHYDRKELNITCNLIHLIKITVLFNEAMNIISTQSTLFTQYNNTQFDSLAISLEGWTSCLPEYITASIFAEPPVLYSSQNATATGTLQDPSRSASFTAYLCLIYGILDLLIALHQKAKLPAGSISKRITRVVYHAHSLTIGDSQSVPFSRFSSIQGNRLVCYGLALSLQAQSIELNEKKKLQSIRSLAFRILDSIHLSTDLYIAIQSLQPKQETSSNNLILTENAHHPKEHGPVEQELLLDDYSIPRSSSSPQTHHHQASYFYTETQQDYQYQQSNWHQYYTYEPPQAPVMYEPTLTSLEEPVTPPASFRMESYFQPTIVRPTQSPCVSLASSEFIPTPVPIYNSKSCKHHRLL